MPIYRHTCTICGHTMEILRSFDEYQGKPKESDPDWQPCKTEEDGTILEHNWTKELGKFLLTRGSNWSGKKGAWLYLFGMIGISLLCKYQNTLI